jgi:hypothetical protein
VIRFVTLGPDGSNHAWVTRRYLALHGVAGRAGLDLVADFTDGAARLLDGRADFMVQCAAHPEAAATVGGYRGRLYLVDTFISPSQPLALLRRRDAAAPRTLALQPATRDYLDLSGWARLVEEPTVSAVGEGLLSGRHEAGIAFAALAEAHPGVLRTEQFIGTVDDAWLVYGREPAAHGGLVAWRDGPAGQRLRAWQ